MSAYTCLKSYAKLVLEPRLGVAYKVIFGKGFREGYPRFEMVSLRKSTTLDFRVDIDLEKNEVWEIVWRDYRYRPEVGWVLAETGTAAEPEQIPPSLKEAIQALGDVWKTLQPPKGAG
ncbi:MAG: hypothetical protein QNJ46_01925 [Leptolyngbyaceae cyanobacterium MO_188.B28]|nr:hypothetical protein [Leptolyngbyaceae cyanobacterium MO_188.B28]